MDWLAMFEREGVEWVILDRRTDGDLIAMLRRRRGWTVEFRDKESMIFARRSR
ncbi:MAG: hypothetical protein JXA93_11145 [Anaerolineae bacterium]|nr:hypothetical protein [Anaerolineae bacterium]